MSEKSRREFLRSISATLAGGAILGSVAGRAANRSPTVSAVSIPPHRPRSLEGVHAYADQLSVASGEAIRFHVSSTHAYEFQVCRLGSDVDSPANDEVLKSWQVDDPLMQPIHPGSYLNVEKGLLADRQLVSLTVECWVRLWDLSGEQAILGQFDLSRWAGFALLVNREGRIGFYLGDGGAYQEKLLLWTDQDAVTRTKTSAASVASINRIANGGRRIERAPWQHIVATFDGRVKKLWLDGKLVVQGEFLGNCKPGTAPLRIGAWGQDGQADGFLDADIAMPAIYAHDLSEEAIERRYQGGGLEPPTNAGLLGCWPLDEEKGDRVADCSGNGRHARIINHATWMIGGPSFPANVERFGDYDPANDDRRGHGLRLASDDLYDCRWQPTIEYRVPTDAKPEIYVGHFRFTRQKTPRLYHALFIVRKPDDKPQSPILFVCSTSTWKAYAGTPFAESWPDVKQAIGHGYVNSPGDPPQFSLYWRHKAGQGACQMGMRTPWPIAGPDTFHQKIEWECSHLCHADRLTMAWLEAEEQVKQVDGGVLRRLCGNGQKRWLVGRGGRFPLPGGPLDDGKFALIEPEEMTCGAGVDHGVARSVVGGALPFAPGKVGNRAAAHTGGDRSEPVMRLRRYIDVDDRAQLGRKPRSGSIRPGSDDSTRSELYRTRRPPTARSRRGRRRRLARISGVIRSAESSNSIGKWNVWQ